MDALEADLAAPGEAEPVARRLVERMALALQASLLVQAAPSEVADAFCGGRLADGGVVFGTLPSGSHCAAIVARASPALA